MSAPRKEYRAGAVWRGSGLTRETNATGLSWIDGAVPTLHGFVTVYAEAKYAHLRFIYDGAEHDLVIRGRSYTKRGLVTIARRFADDVVNEVEL